MNRIQLAGRLTRDPEVRYTQTGRPVASFTLAVKRYPFKKENDEVDFVDVVAWNVLAESVGNTFQKGQLACVQGRLQIRSYETDRGEKKRVAEVVASMAAPPLQSWESRSEGSGPAPRSNQGQNSTSYQSFGSEVLPDEDIPF